MKRRCNICNHENGSCNQYITRDGRGITICPACLAWSNDPRAVMARLAHDEGRLVKPVKETKRGGEEEMTDNVNHPEHYTQGGVECIDALAAAVINLQGLEAVCTANAIKYLWRWKGKNGVEDLQKARWYIDRLIKGCKKVDFYVSTWHEDDGTMPKDCYIIAKLYCVAEPLLCHVDNDGNIVSTYNGDAIEQDKIDCWCSVALNL